MMRLPSLLQEALAAQVSRCALHNPRRPTVKAMAGAAAVSASAAANVGGESSLWEEHRCDPAVLPQVCSGVALVLVVNHHSFLYLCQCHWPFFIWFSDTSAPTPTPTHPHPPTQTGLPGAAGGP